MMERTDRHYRYFMRQITRHTLLYTEMVSVRALLQGKREKFLAFSALERPLALQLGGDDPQELAECSRMAADWGYTEVNLNVGCPSDRAQDSRIGACLMAHPQLVARCVEAMRKAVDLPVTVKHRIGIGGRERYEDLVHFVRTVAQAGCDRFIVHARIALQGLDPHQNRTIPPLRYADVYRLKTECPELVIEINGGVKTLEEVRTHLRSVDGVMIGRAAYENPYLLARVDSLFFDQTRRPVSRREVIEAMIPYVECWAGRGLPPHAILRHMRGLFAHRPGARAWRQLLSTPHRQESGTALLRRALQQIPDEILDEVPSVTSNE